MADMIHWHEGLFLQPHHLQALQQFVVDGWGAALRLAWPFPYGVVDYQLSGDALNNQLVRFDKLRVVMPSGLLLDYPNNADLPALDLRRAFAATGAALNVRLAVPLRLPNRPNVVEDYETTGSYVRRLYNVAEAERSDENTGDNRQPVKVRRLNARLLLDDEAADDVEAVPLLRIGRFGAGEASLPRQDPSFAPPCLVLAGSPVLRDLFRDIAHQVEARQREMQVLVTRGGFTVDSLAGPRVEQYLRFRVLTLANARLRPLLDVAGSLPTFQAYLELRTVAAELAALRPDRDSTSFPAYDHDNPMLAFAELASRLRGMLSNVAPGRVLEVKFVPQGAMHVAELTDEHVTQPNEYFLAIRTRTDPVDLARLVQDRDQFKFMAYSMAGQRAWGVQLQDERTPPVVLRAEAGLYYFRLLRSESARMWEQIVREKKIGVRWPDAEMSDFKMTLCMTIPQPGT